MSIQGGIQNLINTGKGILSGLPMSEKLRDKTTNITNKARDITNKASDIFGKVEQGANAIQNVVDGFVPKTQDNGKSWTELNKDYKSAKKQLKDYKNNYNKIMRSKDPAYNDLKRQTQDEYNRLKANQKQLRKQRNAKGWQNFKNGLSKAFGIGKKIIQGVGGLFK